MSLFLICRSIEILSYQFVKLVIQKKSNHQIDLIIQVQHHSSNQIPSVAYIHHRHQFLLQLVRRTKKIFTLNKLKMYIKRCFIIIPFRTSLIFLHILYNLYAAIHQPILMPPVVQVFVVFCIDLE